MISNKPNSGSQHRIMIIGQPGSGKSTLARIVSQNLSLPVIHIDHIHWQSGWVERSGTEKDRLCREVHARDKWVFEGGRSSTWPERLARADTLIWLDFPLHVRAWRVFKRTIQYYGESRPDLPAGCPEQFNWEFTSWIWNTRHTGRERMRAFFESANDETHKHRLQNRADVNTYIQSLC